MKKILALALALVMVLSLAACGSKDPAPSGNGGTTDPGTSQQGQTNTSAQKDEWPLSTVPAWGGESVRWFYGTEKTIYEINAKGTDENYDAWISALKEAGFVGYRNEAKIQYYGKDCKVYASSRDGSYKIEIETEKKYVFGLPDEIKALFPEYKGDGTLMYLNTREFSDDDYPGTIGYIFYVFDETETGSKEYLKALEAAGFTNDYPDSSYTGGGGYYFKETDGKRLGYQVEEYWRGEGYAEIILTVSEL